MDQGLKGITYQKCYNHEFREAAACCPNCGRFFCRECVTEHEGRVLCKECLENIINDSGVKKTAFGRILQLALFLLGMTTAWSFFYYFGRLLILLPSSFHEGEFWTKGW
jgi:hypothetical protein